MQVVGPLVEQTLLTKSGAIFFTPETVLPGCRRGDQVQTLLHVLGDPHCFHGFLGVLQLRKQAVLLLEDVGEPVELGRQVQLADVGL